MTELAPSVSIQEEILTFLLSSPTPQQIVDFHASEAAQMRLHYLIDANRQGTLSAAERAELDEASAMNHFVTLLKAKAHKVLQRQ
jgi:hypothetical protein